MSYPTASQRAASERIDHALRTRIADGTWPPGHRFTWPEVIAEFLVSPRDVTFVLSPVLRKLRRDGLIEARPQVGSRVTIPGRTWSPPPGYEDLPHDQYIEITLRERLRDALKDEGGYRPGGPFTPSRDLAEEFGVSQSTVRKATAALKEQGLLVTTRNNRTYVAADLARFSEAELLRPPARRRPGSSKLDAFGEARTLAEWARNPRCVVPYTTLYSRYEKGWSLEQALTKPLSLTASRRTKPPAHETPVPPDAYTVAREFILAHISDGTYSPGTVIAATDIAARTGTSEADVVEALDDLHDVRMVSHHPRVGYFAPVRPGMTPSTRPALASGDA
ncbi:DNA-binding GntR family transcriptional regulator [Streptomyces sp. SAI-208]|uniref:GntR family transcriptional regulator n=1 Tax=Streptomyces sp. SAI-208 TaxID=2940550 RepID=UPI002473EC21|nr:GntR family transcriptional regulator [Streptomyces sp. SAI-208]MDH6604525.1 DNA-binding GntR family transcriptional regulator [Streptomyces sp. SAI-208]